MGGGQGNTPLYFREHGDIHPHHFGRASRMYRLLNTPKHNEYSIEAPQGIYAPLIPENNALISPNSSAPREYFSVAPQILKINSASPQIPKNMSQFSLNCIFFP